MVMNVIFVILGIIMLSYGFSTANKLKKQDTEVKRVKNKLSTLTIFFILLLIFSLVTLVNAISLKDLTMIFSQACLLVSFTLFTIYEFLFDSQILMGKKSILFRTVIVDKRNITTYYNEEKNKYYMYIANKAFKINKTVFDELN